MSCGQAILLTRCLSNLKLGLMNLQIKWRLHGSWTWRSWTSWKTMLGKSLEVWQQNLSMIGESRTDLMARRCGWDAADLLPESSTTQNGWTRTHLPQEAIQATWSLWRSWRCLQTATQALISLRTMKWSCPAWTLKMPSCRFLRRRWLRLSCMEPNTQFFATCQGNVWEQRHGTGICVTLWHQNSTSHGAQNNHVWLGALMMECAMSSWCMLMICFCRKFEVLAREVPTTHEREVRHKLQWAWQWWQFDCISQTQNHEDDRWFATCAWNDNRKVGEVIWETLWCSTVSKDPMWFRSTTSRLESRAEACRCKRIQKHSGIVVHGQRQVGHYVHGEGTGGLYVEADPRSVAAASKTDRVSEVHWRPGSEAHHTWIRYGQVEARRRTVLDPWNVHRRWLVKQSST